jgi:hypothetical protein
LDVPKIFAASEVMDSMKSMSSRILSGALSGKAQERAHFARTGQRADDHNLIRRAETARAGEAARARLSCSLARHKDRIG